MQEVKAALEQFAAAAPDGAEPKFEPLPDFAEVAVEWSAYCLRNLRGDLMRLGLDISQALSEFDRGLKHPETLRD